MTRMLSNPSPPTIAVLEEGEKVLHFKRQLHQQLIARMDLNAAGAVGEEELRRQVRRAAEELCRNSPEPLSFQERERLVNEVLDETFGLGPIEALLRDPEVTDVLINGPKTVYVERAGRLEPVDVAFHDERHLVQIIQRIVGRVGRRVDETRPMVDARLQDGSRINAVIPPLALDGALVSIRRFSAKPLEMKGLIERGSIAAEMAQFLAACVRSRLNVLISGGTGSGKTTLLNALSASIPAEERIVTIEDAAELRLQQRHVARLENRPANIEGSGEVTTRDLVRNALRMRPDRIVVGECRGAETLDMLQAMNTGHEGSMTTVHANDSRDALSRLEMMAGMAGFDFPLWILRRQIAAAIHIIVQVARLRGGVRKVTKISEITGMEGDVISMHDLFAFKQTGLDSRQTAVGTYVCAGLRPLCLERLEVAGCQLPRDFFERRSLPSCG